MKIKKKEKSIRKHQTELLTLPPPPFFLLHMALTPKVFSFASLRAQRRKSHRLVGFQWHSLTCIQAFHKWCIYFHNTSLRRGVFICSPDLGTEGNGRNEAWDLHFRLKEKKKKRQKKKLLQNLELCSIKPRHKIPLLQKPPRTLNISAKQTSGCETRHPQEGRSNN